MTRIKMYPAGNGDAFLVTHQGKDRAAVLIDGGYGYTFHDHILPDLRQLSHDGYHLDLVVATHIDSDHIAGLVEFFSLNREANSPKIIPVKQVWHNSLRALTSPKSQARQLSAGDKDLLVEIQRAGYPRPSANSSVSSEISAHQGSSLASLLLAGGYTWNGGDGFRAIEPVLTAQHDLNESCNVTVIGPPSRRLRELEEWWRAELSRIGFTGAVGVTGLFDDAFEFLSASADLGSKSGQREISARVAADRELGDCYVPDDSVTNASSVSIIIQMGSMRLLFLGDSVAEDAEAGLKQVLPQKLPLVFDLIKTSHHGSFRNTSPALLQLIDSPRYLFSTNGERHHHPDFEVLKAVVDRPAGFRRALFFNYSSPASRQLKNYISKSGASFSVHEGITEPISLG